MFWYVCSGCSSIVPLCDKDSKVSNMYRLLWAHIDDVNDTIIAPLKNLHGINIDVASQGHVHQTLNSSNGVTLTSGGGGDTQGRDQLSITDIGWLEIEIDVSDENKKHITVQRFNVTVSDISVEGTGVTCTQDKPFSLPLP